jgi:hypothetical protein
MTIKKMPNTARTGTASKTTFDSRNRTGSDSMIGWFNSAKPSRNRQQKRERKQNQRGQIDYALAGQLALLLVALALILAGVAA